MSVSAEPPVASGPDSDDPMGLRYPNTARIWNYQLGGKDNYAIDRKASEAANAMVRALGVPDGAETAVESRRLLQRMVDYMLSQGVRQFLDLGSGLPNMANTHQIAHRAAPDARIIQLAFAQGSKVEINLMPVMLKRLTYTGSTLRTRPPAFKARVAREL